MAPLWLSEETYRAWTGRLSLIYPGLTPVSKNLSCLALKKSQTPLLRRWYNSFLPSALLFYGNDNPWAFSSSSFRLLVSSGSIKVGLDTVKAAAKTCPGLRVVNLNYTSVTPVSLVPLITECPHLEVLKLEGIQNWVSSQLMNNLLPFHSLFIL